MAKAQGVNAFSIFAMTALPSFTSSWIVTNAGWDQINLAALLLVVLVIGAVLWLARCGPARRGALV